MGVITAPEQYRRRRLRCQIEPLDVVDESNKIIKKTSVAVMAPALTEGGPQKPKNILSSPLPLSSSGFLTPKKASKICNNREVIEKFVVSENVQPSKIDENCLRGLSKNLIRNVINSNYENSLDCLKKHCTINNSNDLMINSNFVNDIDIIRVEEDNNYIDKKIEKKKENIKVNNLNLVKCSSTVILPDELITEVCEVIMNENTSIINEEEANDEMGFIKTNDIVPIIPIVDNNLNDDKVLDGIIGINNDELTSQVVGDITQNVDDILKVIESMEDDDNAAVAADAADADDNGEIINDDNNDNNEQVNTPEIFNMSEGFTSFERDLLNEVDVDVINLVNENMNINIGLNIGDSELQRDNNIKLKQDSIENKCFEQDRRTAFLMRRLRKLQARNVGKHIAEETTGVIELAHHSVKKYFLNELQNISGNKLTARNLPQIIPDTLNSFIKNIEKSCIAQSNMVTAHCNRQRNYCRYFGAGSRDIGLVGTSSNRNTSTFGSGHIKLDNEQVENVAGSLTTQMHVVESNLDSDCTASSSGGESCDEMQNYNNSHQQQLPISKRAAWKYAQDRAGVASRWTWLQAQISDLEYKIRQHNDLQRQMRAAKGFTYLENAETINGYSGVLPGSTRHSVSTVNDPEPTPTPSTASRTRPFVWDVYRKRKLLRLEGLHDHSKRAARSSTIKCACDGTLACCAICTGRRDPTQPQEPFELLSPQERIALVDPGYHPVLSFPEDVTHSTHFEAIMKTVDWQQKILRGNLRIPRVKDKETTERRKNKLPEHRTKYTSTTRIKKSSSSSLLTARIKRKMSKGKRETTGQGKNMQNISRKRVPKISQGDEDDDVSAQSSSSKHSSPVPSPLQQNPTAIADKVPQKERNSNSHPRQRQNSYDIDNIVIPYSVAASTRLEKLQYKEILTPKWRVCDDNVGKGDVKNGVVHRTSQDSDFEDMSEETITMRHERSEREESKRFMSLLNMLPQNRLRHSRRADSRADSGANTPDPMSPHASDFGGDVTSPITSPPATPSGGQDTEQHNTDHRNSSSLQNAIRRRTISSSMRVPKEDASSIHEDDNEVLPYEPRLFPLPEEIYDKMLEVMPDGHWQNSSTSPLGSRDEEKIDEEVEMDPSESDTTESAYCDADGEDPNDPEWTVADDRDAEKERIRSTAKR